LALQGTLDTFSLPDVLRLLATTSKTGRLRIDGDRGRGSVWLADGGVVDADADRTLDGTPVDEVVFELLRFETGNFAFDGDDTGAAGGKPEDVEALLRRANALLGEWNELEAVVPSLEHEVTLSRDLSTDEVTINADNWQSVVAVASGRTVGELASALGLTELGVSRAVRDLVELGVVDVSLTDRPRPAAPAPAPAARDERSRRPAPAADVEPAPIPDIPAPPAGQSQRAGWLGDRTGEIPIPVHDTPPGSARNGAPQPDVTPAPAPPAPEPAPKGGLASRLGRNRNGSASGRNADATPTEPTPAVTNGTRPGGRSPVAPTARTNDAGPKAEPPADTDRPRRADGPARRRPDVARPTPPASPARPGSLGPPSTSGTPSGPSPFDDGRLGPPPVGRDTGQIRGVSPSALPPDLHWAADDTGNIPITGNGASPFSGLSRLPGGGPGGPSVPPAPVPSDGEIAPHVAAMSPEARSAVQSTVGNAGGSGGARGGSQGEDIAQRGRLISFLSSVR
jgi:hypothetical protein